MIEPTTLTDVHALNPAATFDVSWRDFLAEVAGHNELAAFLETYCRTIWFNGEILAIGGVSRLWPGVGEVWLCQDQHGTEHPIVLTRAICKLIETAKYILSAHRLQITIPPCSEPGWATIVERLGFAYEGELRNYIRPGENYRLFAWTP